MYRDIPEFALVMIIGQDEISTKSFAKKYFKQEEMVNKEDLESKAEERLEARKLTVILLEDQKEQAYEIFIQLAKRHHCKPVAFILQTSPEEEEARRIEALTATLQKKGFKQIERVDCEQDDQHMTIRRVKLANNKRKKIFINIIKEMGMSPSINISCYAFHRCKIKLHRFVTPLFRLLLLYTKAIDTEKPIYIGL